MASVATPDNRMF